MGGGRGQHKIISRKKGIRNKWKRKQNDQRGEEIHYSGPSVVYSWLKSSKADSDFIRDKKNQMKGLGTPRGHIFNTPREI